MQNIIVGRYSNPETRKHWQGWIEPEDQSWIAFIDGDGHPVFFLDRDPDTGSVIIYREEEDVSVQRVGADGLFMGERGGNGEPLRFLLTLRCLFCSHRGPFWASQ